MRAGRDGDQVGARAVTAVDRLDELGEDVLIGLHLAEADYVHVDLVEEKKNQFALKIMYVTIINKYSMPFQLLVLLGRTFY